MLSNCGIGEDSWESLAQQWHQTNQSKGNQPLIVIGRTDAKDETPKLWSSDVKSQSIGKDPDDGEDRRQVEQGATEDEMVGWHHWFNRHELQQIPGDRGGPGSLVHCSPSGREESDTTEHWTATTIQRYY